jgi:hypothetical protein
MKFGGQREGEIRVIYFFFFMHNAFDTPSGLCRTSNPSPTDHILSLACFCHIPTAGSCAGLQTPNLDISSGLQMAVTIVQLSLNQIPTAAVLLESKPVYMKTLGMNCQWKCPVQFSVMISSSAPPFTMALFELTTSLNAACLPLQLYFKSTESLLLQRSLFYILFGVH